MVNYNDDVYRPMPYTNSGITGNDYPNAQAKIGVTNSFGQVVVWVKNHAQRDGYGHDVYWQMYDANMVPVGTTAGFPYGPSGSNAFDGNQENNSGPYDIDSAESVSTEGSVGYRNGARYLTIFQSLDVPKELITFTLLAFGEEPPAEPEPVAKAPARPIDSGCILGCSTDYQVLVTNRCGTSTVCELDNISELTWGRVLDDTSEAIIVMDLSGDGESGTCCDCVGNVRSWIHSVVVLRDGELVWGPGPVTNVLYKREQVAITARDVSAWMDVRKVHTDMDFLEEDTLLVAQTLIEDAMRPDDPCGIAQGTYVQPSAIPIIIDREYTSEDPSEYAGDAFRELARTTLDYTVLGSSILLGAPLIFGPYATLKDEDFLVDIEVEERGLETATHWTVQSDLALGVAGGPDTYYGLLEQIVEEAAIDDDDQAAEVATNRLMASNPAPLYVNVPDEARLSPDAPVCMEQLVPGTLVNVNIRGQCREVYTQLKLTAVKVRVADGGDEEVGITLSPPGTALIQAEA